MTKKKKTKRNVFVVIGIISLLFLLSVPLFSIEQMTFVSVDKNTCESEVLEVLEIKDTQTEFTRLCDSSNFEQITSKTKFANIKTSLNQDKWVCRLIEDVVSIEEDFETSYLIIQDQTVLGNLTNNEPFLGGETVFTITDFPLISNKTDLSNIEECPDFLNIQILEGDAIESTTSSEIFGRLFISPIDNDLFFVCKDNSFITIDPQFLTDVENIYSSCKSNIIEEPTQAQIDQELCEDSDGTPIMTFIACDTPGCLCQCPDDSVGWKENLGCDFNEGISEEHGVEKKIRKSVFQLIFDLISDIIDKLFGRSNNG